MDTCRVMYNVRVLNQALIIKCCALRAHFCAGRPPSEVYNDAIDPIFMGIFLYAGDVHSLLRSIFCASEDRQGLQEQFNTS